MAAVFAFNFNSAVFAEEAETIQIGTAAELISFSERVNGGESALNAVLTADIDLEGKQFTPIGNWVSSAERHYYDGAFDGNGYTITNLTVNESYTVAGLFGYVRGEVKNINVTNGSVSCDSDLSGGIASILNVGKIQNCSYSGSVKGVLYVGGIVGRNQYGTVSGCYSEGTVTGSVPDTTKYDSYTGGIVGDNFNNTTGIAALIENCHNKAVVNGVGCTGGITGYNRVGCTVKDCVNEGNVNGTGSLAGGIVGVSYGDLITNCANYGDVTIKNETLSTLGGGIVGCCDQTLVTYCQNYGNVNCYAQHVGGIAGAIQSSSKVVYCFNKGTVTAEGDSCNNVGGIVGNNSPKTSGIENCYNMGNVLGNEYVGGVVGLNSSSIKNCYNIASVEAIKTRGNAGSIVGYTSAEILNCYYINTASKAAGYVYSDTNVELTAKSEEEFSSGEVTYLLNGSVNAENGSDSVWKQTIGTDAYPEIYGLSAESLEVVGFTEEVGGNMLYANRLTDDSIKVGDTADGDFSIIVDSEAFGGSGAKYLEAVKVLSGDEQSQGVSNYAYTDESGRYAGFVVKRTGSGEMIIRAEVVSAENADKAAEGNYLYYVTETKAFS